MTIDPKRANEESTCRRFLAVYNQLSGTSHALEQMGEAPDCQCSGNLHIEVVTAYYDTSVAQNLWQLVRGRITLAEANRNARVPVEPDQAIKDSIDTEIRKKVLKPYQVGGVLFLVVRVQAPLTTFEDLDAEYLRAPRGIDPGPFDEVWILCADNSGVDKVGKVLLK